MNNILYISFVDWFWIKQRPHHIPEILSEKNNVTYLCFKPWKKNANIVCLHNENDKNDINKGIIKKDKLTIKRCTGIPFNNRIGFIKKLNNILMKNIINNLIKKEMYNCIIITHPSQLEYIDKFVIENIKIIYDCMDNYSEFNNDNRKIKLNEQRLIDVSKYTVTSSEVLKNKLISRYENISNSKITVINNGVDTNIFIPQYNNIIKKRIGYVGTISHWFDFDLIKKSALSNPDYEYYIVGPNEVPEKSLQLENIKNIKFVGSKSYTEVPYIMSTFDVCIMPFIVNDLVKSVNPVKIYEYLAMDKPVLTIEYPEILKFEKYVYLYKSYEEFESQLKKALNAGSNNDRVEFAFANSWYSRVKEMENLINL